MPENQIVIIGAGNVATNLAFAFHKADIKKFHILSKTEQSAKELADKLHCPYLFDIEQIPENGDLYILSINDEALPKLAENQKLKQKIDNSLIVHTAGSISLDILKNLSVNYGVFLPFTNLLKNQNSRF